MKKILMLTIDGIGLSDNKYGNAIAMANMKNYKELSLAAHKRWRGKIEMKPRVPVETRDDLSIA